MESGKRNGRPEPGSPAAPTEKQTRGRLAQLEAANRALASRVGQLERANQEFENFSYTVSHDLKAPVRHIIGYADLLEQRDLSALDEKTRHYIEAMTEAARKMGTLIDSLLAYSRIGRVEMSRTCIDLRRLTAEVVAELTSGREGEIAIEVGALPVVAGDRSLLRQVLVNLVGNAIKFSRTRPRPRIEVGSATGTGAPGEALFFVRDNGVGFDPRYTDKLFGLFQHLHAQDEFEGTGVGLAIVQRIVQRHGGRVWAEGEPDRGATFFVALPRAEEVQGSCYS